MSRHRIVIGFLLAVLAVLYLKEAYDFSGLAGLLPKVLGYCLLLLSAVMIIQGLGKLAYIDKKPSTVTLRKLLIALSILAMSYLYIASMEYFGFILPTILFLFVFMLFLGEKKLIRTGLISIVASVLIMLLFTKVMYVPFPEGSLISLFR